MTTASITSEIVKQQRYTRFSPLRSLTPATLTRQLDGFAAGHIAEAARTWDAMLHRDDTLAAVASKRIKSAAHLPWEIVTTEDSPAAEKQSEILLDFWNNITATSAVDENITGSMRLLLAQMMSAVGMRYAVHEVVWQPHEGKLRAQLRFVPLWFFENTTGRLRFSPTPGSTQGQDLDENAWLVHHGDGLMEASSVAWMFKHMPLNDWLIYCERNGMPGIKGTTDAAPGSNEWDEAVKAVQSFGAEWSALFTRGTEIDAVDMTSKGELPYPALVDRMDRAMVTLWRGADLSTMSRGDGARGASVQEDETALLIDDDAAALSESLWKIERTVLDYHFGTGTQPLAYIKLAPPSDENDKDALDLLERLQRMGMPIAITATRERFGVPEPTGDEDILKPAAPAQTDPITPAANARLSNESTDQLDRFLDAAADQLAEAGRADAADIIELLESLADFADTRPTPEAFLQRAQTVRDALPDALSDDGSALAEAYERIFSSALLDAAATDPETTAPQDS